MATLFAIGNDFGALDLLLDENGGDVSDPAVNQIVTQWQNELGKDEAVKLENYCQYILRMESEAAVARAEADQFNKKAKTRDARVKWLKDTMKAYLQSQNRKEAQTSAGRKISVQNNGGALPLVIDEAKGIPTEFQRQKIVHEIDRDKIVQALAAGQSLDFAKFGERGTQLRIR